MKKITLLLFLGLSPYFFAQNLVTNPGMESWTESAIVPDGYKNSNPITTAGGFYLSTDTHTGTKALNVQYSSTVPGAYWFRTPIVNNLAPGTYTAKVWVKGKGSLRYISLSQLTAAPSKTVSSTNIVAFPFVGTGDVVKDLAVWTEFSVTFKINDTYGGNYYLYFSFNNTNEAEGKPFLFDDISLEYTPISNLTNTIGGSTANVKNIKADTYEYTVQLSSNLNDAPVVSATAVDASASISITQATSVTGDLSNRTATVTVGNGVQNTQYKVIYDKSDSFIDGITGTSGTIGSYANFYILDALSNHGDYLGDGGLRVLTSGTTTGWYETPELTNGAGILTFWVKKYDNTNFFQTSSLKVISKTSSSSYDTEHPLLTIPATELTTADWVQKSIVINSANNTTRIKLYIDKTDESRDFYIDDIKITSYLDTSTKNASVYPEKFKVYTIQKTIVIESETQESYRIYTSTGQLKNSGDLIGSKSISGLNTGIYIVKIGNRVLKTTIQ